MTDDPYERYLDDVGRAVHRATTTTVSRRVPVALGGVLATVAIAVIVLLVGAPGRSPVDVLGRAAAALRSPDTLLHYVVTATPVKPNGTLTPPAASDVTCPQTEGIEVWQTFAPNRWRVVLPPTPQGDECPTMATGDGQVIRGRQELSWNAGTTERYIPASNRLDILRGFSANSAAADVPIGLPDVGGGDPVDLVRDLLAKGLLVDRGTSTLNGRQVRALAGTKRQRNRIVATTTTVLYAVDAKTFEPVRVITTFEAKLLRRPNAPNLPATTQQLDFTKYRREPLTPSNRDRLTITPPRNSKTTDQNLNELRARQRRESER